MIRNLTIKKSMLILKVIRRIGKTATNMRKLTTSETFSRRVELGPEPSKI